jgi:hypothetical protein
MKKAFTLMEVNLAILIMAGGVLSILGLYSLGYRENRQSREDVASAAYADAVMSPLVMALSATNLKWSTFRNIQSRPSEEGWSDYFNKRGIAISSPESLAKSAYSGLLGSLGYEGSANRHKSEWPSTASGGLKAGLVILHDEGSSVVKIGFRATKNPAELLAMPLYYTEVRFQGVIDSEE